MRWGALPSAGADGPVLFCPKEPNLIGSFSLSYFSIGRLPRFGQDPPPLEGWAVRGRQERSPWSQGRGGSWQALTVGRSTLGEDGVAALIEAEAY